VRKLGVSGYEELAMGAVATGGFRVLNNEIVRGLGISEHEIDAVVAREMHELTRRDSVPALEHLITEAMDEWKGPGLAVAVVQNGEVALVRAYGLRDVEAGLKVTTDRQFQIASVTKSFTATGLAVLVDKGRMDWGFCWCSGSSVAHADDGVDQHRGSPDTVESHRRKDDRRADLAS
jgi:hypothetical protein